MNHSSIEVVPSGGPVGAEICGVDLSKTIDQDTFRQIEDAFATYGVLCFRKQDIEPQDQVAFSCRFGELERLTFSQFTLTGRPDVLLITNIEENGKHIGIHDAGREWHADSTYVPSPSLASFLYAREVPVEDGKVLGDTLFVPAFGHFEEFDTDRQSLLAGLESIHRMDPRLVKESGKAPPQATHPVIVTHPRTGRKCLFVNEGRSVNFVGMDEEESRPLLRNLLERLRSPERIYTHKWQVGDLLMWDNIAVQHRATHDYSWPKHRRLMHRTTVKGSPLS